MSKKDEMKDIDSLRDKLSDRNLSEVARRTGIPYKTLIDFYNGKFKVPNALCYIKLKEYFNDQI